MKGILAGFLVFFSLSTLVYILKVAWCSYSSSSKSADSEVHPHLEGKAEFWFLHLKRATEDPEKDMEMIKEM